MSTLIKPLFTFVLLFVLAARSENHGIPVRGCGGLGFDGNMPLASFPAEKCTTHRNSLITLKAPIP